MTLLVGPPFLLWDPITISNGILDQRSCDPNWHPNAKIWQFLCSFHALALFSNLNKSHVAICLKSTCIQCWNNNHCKVIPRSPSAVSNSFVCTLIVLYCSLLIIFTLTHNILFNLLSHVTETHFLLFTLFIYICHGVLNLPQTFSLHQVQLWGVYYLLLLYTLLNIPVAYLLTALLHHSDFVLLLYSSSRSGIVHFWVECWSVFRIEPIWAWRLLWKWLRNTMSWSWRS